MIRYAIISHYENVFAWLKLLVGGILLSHHIHQFFSCLLCPLIACHLLGVEWVDLLRWCDLGKLCQLAALLMRCANSKTFVDVHYGGWKTMTLALLQSEFLKLLVSHAIEGLSGASLPLLLSFLTVAVRLWLLVNAVLLAICENF